MEVFEVHITADEGIINIAKRLGIKTISVDLLRPDRTVLRTEHMTSQIVRAENYEACKRQVDWMLLNLDLYKVRVYRVKIESPCYDHYVGQSLYMESHFQPTDDHYPLSRNQRKETLLATDREYDKQLYDLFKTRWADKEVELCLYDTFVEEDKDWFDCYRS